tara:strand:+ start:19684 stop:20028 length:345 start_codon:yes stop_codon:yes gene_type:complete
MLKLNHKKLIVWQKSIELVKYVYIITKSFPRHEQYGLISQLRRCAVSIAANIAEGASRKSRTESSRYIEIARSSLVELDTHIEISIKIEYLKKQDIKEIENLTNEVFAMLTAMK